MLKHHPKVRWSTPSSSELMTMASHDQQPSNPQAQDSVANPGERVENGEHVICGFGKLGFERELKLAQDWIIRSTHSGGRYTLVRSRRWESLDNGEINTKPYQFLRTLRHPHLAQLIGTFSDQRASVIGMVLSPPAEYHLSDYLERVAKHQFEDTEMHKNRLKTFFGCLASGIDFLQHHHIRLPVSPNIILVSEDTVVFPPSHGIKYYDGDRSGPMSYIPDDDETLYQSALRDSHDGDKDIKWLGLIFLDVLAALNDTHLYDLLDEAYSFYEEGWKCWRVGIHKLEERVSPDQKIVIEWIKEMLFKDGPGLTPGDILLRIQSQEAPGEDPNFCGPCCVGDAGIRGKICPPNTSVGARNTPLRKAVPYFAD